MNGITDPRAWCLYQEIIGSYALVGINKISFQLLPLQAALLCEISFLHDDAGTVAIEIYLQCFVIDIIRIYLIIIERLLLARLIFVIIFLISLILLLFIYLFSTFY